MIKFLLICLLFGGMGFAQEKPSVSIGIGMSTALGNLKDDFGNVPQYRIEVTLPYYIDMELISQISYANWSVKGYELNHYSGLAGLRLYLNSKFGLAIDAGLALHMLQGEGPKTLLLTDKESDFGYEFGFQIFKMVLKNQEISFRTKATQLWTKPRNSFFLSNYLNWGLSW